MPFLKALQKTHNYSRHSGLYGEKPADLLKLKMEAINRFQARGKKQFKNNENPLRVWSQSQNHQNRQIKKYLGAFVRIKILPEIFQKKSSLPVWSSELFSIRTVRTAVNNFKDQHLLLNLVDLKSSEIEGAFQLSEGKIIKPWSRFHPCHPDYKPHIKKILQKGRKFWQVEFAGMKRTL